MFGVMANMVRCGRRYPPTSYPLAKLLQGCQLTQPAAATLRALLHCRRVPVYEDTETSEEPEVGDAYPQADAPARSSGAAGVAHRLYQEYQDDQYLAEEESDEERDEVSIVVCALHQATCCRICLHLIHALVYLWSENPCEEWKGTHSWHELGMARTDNCPRFVHLSCLA